MPPIDYALSLAQAMLEEIETYLLSPEVFWPLAGKAAKGMQPYPRMTIGGLLLTLDELSALEARMTKEQKAVYRQLRTKIAQAAGEQRAIFERKCRREMLSRLSLWRAFIEDIEISSSQEGAYPQEVRQRVMLARLQNQISPDMQPSDLADRLQNLDARLRSRFEPGDFIWDSRLADLYPREDFWYLYGNLRPGG